MKTCLTQNEVQYIAGGTVSGDLLRLRLENPPSGQTEAAFFALNKKWLAEQADHHKKNHALSDDDAAAVKRAEANHLTQAREAAARRAETDSLVNGRKSPTQQKRTQNQARVLSLLSRSIRPDGRSTDTPFDEFARYDAAQAGKPVALVDGYAAPRENGEKHLRTGGAVAALCHRAWNNQTKIQIVAQTVSQAAPAPQSGVRSSESLTPRAVKNIIEAGAYTATVEALGLRTFATFTFNECHRRRVLSGHLDVDAPYTQITQSVLGYVPVCEIAGAYSPVSFNLHQAKPIADVAGEYCTLPAVVDYAGAFCWIEDRPRQYRKAGFTATAKVVNAAGEVAGAFCPLDSHPMTANQGGIIAGAYCPLERKPARLWEACALTKTTIGKEMSRTLDALKKMFERGWAYKNDDGHKVTVPPTEGEFRYIWVAESPANDAGEPNPHAHLLTNIAVEPQHFAAFCQRVEAIWGNGFAHFERIRNKHAASSYIIKAVGYAAKGDNGSQGWIEGNRYGISRSARAPKWEVLATFEAERMSAVISECRRRLDNWKAPQKQEMDRQRFIINQAKKLIAIENNKAAPDTDLIKRHTARLKHAEKAMFDTRAAMLARGVRVSGEGRFCIAFENDADFSRSLAFLGWAHGARGWSFEPRDVEGDAFISLRDEAAAHWFPQKQYFEARQAYWRVLLASAPPQEPDYLEQDRIAEANWHYLTGEITDDRRDTTLTRHH